MITAKAPPPPCSSGLFRKIESGPSSAAETLGFAKLRGINVSGLYRSRSCFVLHARSKPIKAKENAGASLIDDWFKPIKGKKDSDTEDRATAFSGTAIFVLFTIKIWNLELMSFSEMQIIRVVVVDKFRIASLYCAERNLDTFGILIFFILKSYK